MSSALKADRFRTLGGVLSAWCLFDEHTDCGKLDGYTPGLLDEVVGFAGLAAAMASVDWLVVGENYLLAPRFQKHNGKTAKRRCQESDRKMSAREADKKRTREEKRREEITHTPRESSAGMIEKIRLAYPRHTHIPETCIEVAAAIRRNGGNADGVLDGVLAIAKAVAGWTENERIQFLKIPPGFFAGDHWKDDPAFWASKVAGRKELNGKKPMQALDLGGRKPTAILELK